MRRAFTLAIALAPLLVLPAATAHAQSAPPDNSGIDQYIEDTPGAGGDRPGGAGGGGGPAALPERSTAALGSDPEGAAALDLAAKTAPRGADRSRGGDGDDTDDDGERSGQPGAGPSSGSGPGVGSAVGEITTGESGGMGLGLPVILGLALVAAVVVGVSRLRRHRAHHP